MKKIMMVLMLLVGCGQKEETPQEKAAQAQAQAQREEVRKVSATKKAVENEACLTRASKGSHNPKHPQGFASCERCPCHMDSMTSCAAGCSFTLKVDRKDVNIKQVHETLETLGSKERPATLKEARRLGREVCACACER